MGLLEQKENIVTWVSVGPGVSWERTRESSASVRQDPAVKFSSQAWKSSICNQITSKNGN